MVPQFVMHHAWLGDSLAPTGTGIIASGGPRCRRRTKDICKWGSIT